MKVLRPQTLISLLMLLSAFLPAAARDIITETPEGKAVSYYADFLNYDNTFGFMGDYHSLQQIVFSEDGTKAYIPNLLLRRTMPAYVEGTVDAEKKTITVESGQWVFFFPNAEIPVALYPLDSKGNAGPNQSSFYTAPLVFDIADNGIISLRTTPELPMFGLCNTGNSEEVYANAKELRFIPAEAVERQLDHCDYSYSIDGEETYSFASKYFENDDTLWIRGFVPKYPQAWVKVERQGEGWVAPSFQVQYFFATEDPIVFAATDGRDLFQALPVTIDEESGEIVAAENSLIMCTASPDNSGSFEIYLKYYNLMLTPATVKLSTPAAPVFKDYEKLTSETMFRFSATPTDTAGELLPKDCLYFRFHIDGEPYTFTPSEYRWINSPMEMVPYTFDNYNFFSQGGANNEDRYVYFQKLPSKTETIAVELVYILNGEEAVSGRLIYNIKTGESETSGIQGICGDGEAEYYDLLGKKVYVPEAGRVYIRCQGNKSEKIILK